MGKTVRNPDKAKKVLSEEEKEREEREKRIKLTTQQSAYRGRTKAEYGTTRKTPLTEEQKVKNREAQKLRDDKKRTYVQLFKKRVRGDPLTPEEQQFVEAFDNKVLYTKLNKKFITKDEPLTKDELQFLKEYKRAIGLEMFIIADVNIGELHGDEIDENAGIDVDEVEKWLNDENEVDENFDNRMHDDENEVDENSDNRMHDDELPVISGGKTKQRKPNGEHGGKRQRNHVSMRKNKQKISNKITKKISKKYQKKGRKSRRRNSRGKVFAKNSRNTPRSNYYRHGV